MSFAKIGFHIGTPLKLYDRYVTAYGGHMELIMFELEVISRAALKILEDECHDHLIEFSYTNELFFKGKDSFDKYCQFVINLEEHPSYCSLRDSPPVKNRNKAFGVKKSVPCFEDIPDLDKQTVTHLQTKRHTGKIRRIERIYLAKYEFVQYFIIERNRIISSEDQASIFDASCRQQNNRDLLDNLCKLENADEQTKILMDKIISILGLKSLNDQNQEIQQSIMQTNLVTLLTITDQLRKIFNRSGKKKNASIRHLLENLNVCFRSFGMQFNIFHRHQYRNENGKKSEIRTWKIKPADDFSELVFGSGLF